MEAIRQLSIEVGYHNYMIIHVTLLPYVIASGELKSKPTQHSVMKLREIGLSPDMILCRSEHPIEQSERDKIALFCNRCKIFKRGGLKISNKHHCSRYAYEANFKTD